MMDNPDDIEFKPIVEMLQHENERLRLRIVKLYNTRQPLDGLNARAAKKFLVDNYLVISACALLFFVLISFISTVKDFFTGKE